MRLAGFLATLVSMLALTGASGAGIYVPPPPGDSIPTWSPDASVIVFMSERDGPSLRVTAPDGSDERRIPWLPASAWYSFSPDWSHVAGPSSPNGFDMVVERLDGSGRVNLGSAIRGPKPSWSADGGRITYHVQSQSPSSADVVVARIDGSEVRRIAVGSYPDWSPTLDLIAYLDPGGNIHTIRPDGTGDTAITAGSVRYDPPRWSPVGPQIATFHRSPGVNAMRGTLEIWSTAGARLASIPFLPGSDYAWSPRGDAIAYSTGGGVFVLDLASRKSRQLAPFGGSIAWSPDGQQLAFSAGGECRDRSGIYRVSVDNPQPLRLSNDCRIVGTEGNDVLVGTPPGDVILGLGGDDRLTAVADFYTGDTLYGGPGDDVLFGSSSGDTLDGGPGIDVLIGGAGPDLLRGGPGRDTLRGEGRRDLIDARDGGPDFVSCGTNASKTTGPEGDVAYVDGIDKVSSDCEYVYRPGAAPPVRGRISLVIRVWPKGNRTGKTAPRVYTLRCRPASGTLPRSASACTRLIRVQNPFAPVPPATACSQIYGGPQTASVRGVYGGRTVRASFNRQSGCEIKRWDRIGFLFPLR